MSPKVRDVLLGGLAVFLFVVGVVRLLAGSPVGWLCLVIAATVFIGIARRRRLAV